MNGEVDVSGRALIVLLIRPSHGADAVSLQAWVDTAFTGELVIPRATITRWDCHSRPPSWRDWRTARSCAGHIQLRNRLVRAIIRFHGN